MKVIINLEVIDFLKELTQILYKQEYFGFEESAHRYVDKLFDVIDNIDSYPSKKAPAHFSRYGKNLYYVNCKANSRTTWYIFFQREDDTYLIRHVTNNHASSRFMKG